MFHNKTVRAFTLIEVVIFIVILAITIGILIPLGTILLHVHRIDRSTTAIELAQQRMELILGQKHKLGYADFIIGNNYDPCKKTYIPPQQIPAVCTLPSEYTATSSIATWADNSGNNDYRLITVTINNTTDGTQMAQLQSVVAEY